MISFDCLVIIRIFGTSGIEIAEKDKFVIRPKCIKVITTSKIKTDLIFHYVIHFMTENKY